MELRKLAALAAALALSSGCLHGGLFQVTASSPLALTSFAYDGRGGRELPGALNATLYDGRNSGTIEAVYRDAVDVYRITWKNFTGRYPYEDGGIETQAFLFGDTGNGPATLPRLYAHAAAWGTAEYYVDEVLQPDPHSLYRSFDAVFFVSQGKYRDDETRVVSGGEDNRTYDPRRPEQSRLNEIGSMAVIGLFTKRGDLYRLVEFSEVEIVAS